MNTIIVTGIYLVDIINPNAIDLVVRRSRPGDFHL